MTRLPFLPAALAATLILGTALPAAANEGTAQVASAATEAAPSTMAAPDAAARVDGTLDYVALMKLPLHVRFEIVAALPDAERDAFLGSLTADRRAALIADPDDCSVNAMTRRMAVANKYADQGADESFVEGGVKDAGSAALKGALNFMFSGLGNVVASAAKVNEARKVIVAYRDICALTPDEKTALLEGREVEQARPANRPEPSFLDKASGLLSR